MKRPPVACVGKALQGLGQVGKAQADARSVMTGRITDAYTNIATVKLFSHTRRESEFARAAMDAFKLTGYAQMRLVKIGRASCRERVWTVV